MSLHKILAVSAALATTIHGQQAGLFECDGLRYPNLEACNGFMDEAGWSSGSSTEYISNDSGQNGYCIGYINNGVNCFLSLCFTGEGSYPVYFNNIKTLYDQTLVNFCIDERMSGGVAYAEGAKFSLSAYNNPDYMPPSAGVAGRSLPPSNMTRMTVDEIEALFKENEKKSIVPEELARRQNPPDSDTEWVTISLAQNVPREDHRTLITPGARPGGSSFMISEETSETFGVEVSVSVSAGLEGVFTAETSVSFSYDRTQSTTVGETYVIDCAEGEEGVLYWYPLWNEYFGEFRPSGTQVTFWEPLNGKFGNVLSECLG